jgi:hypothetical protein
MFIGPVENLLDLPQQKQVNPRNATDSLAKLSPHLPNKSATAIPTGIIKTIITTATIDQVF